VTDWQLGPSFQLLKHPRPRALGKHSLVRDNVLARAQRTEQDPQVCALDRLRTALGPIRAHSRSHGGRHGWRAAKKAGKRDGLHKLRASLAAKHLQQRLVAAGVGALQRLRQQPSKLTHVEQRIKQFAENSRVAAGILFPKGNGIVSRRRIAQDANVLGLLLRSPH
jgi:hypothetical protein